MEDRYNELKLAERGARISIISYMVLAVIKLVVGNLSNSKALTADGFNNTTDIIASLAVLIGLRISRKPADEEHLYGHFRAETIASLVASLIMIAVALDVLYNAAHAIIFFEAKVPDLIAALVTCISAVFIYIVYRYNKKIAIKINSPGLMASAKDNLSDAWVSIGTTIGIVASQFGFSWVDSITAFIVGILIAKTGWDIFKESSHNLTDGFDRKELDNITESIKKIPGVKIVKDIKARMHGNKILLDTIVGVSVELSIVEGHRITEKIEEKLKSEFNIAEIVVHIEPDS